MVLLVCTMLEKKKLQVALKELCKAKDLNLQYQPFKKLNNGHLLNWKE
jgi:hypothetical protein